MVCQQEACLAVVEVEEVVLSIIKARRHDEYAVSFVYIFAQFGIINSVRGLVIVNKA